MTKELPSKEYLQTLFRYTEDGNLWWKEYRSGVNLSKSAGCIDKTKGYYKIKIDGVKYWLHRVIYHYHHGNVTPNLQIDHIDRNPCNNKIDNLRLVTIRENSLNRSMRRDCGSGYQGVSRSRYQWKAQLTVNGDRKVLGYFSTPEEAHKCYQQAKQSITK
jgi:hypothetical protein